MKKAAMLESGHEKHSPPLPLPDCVSSFPGLRGRCRGPLRRPEAPSGDPESELRICCRNENRQRGAIGAPYTDHAVFVGFDGTCTQGRSEIEKMYRARFESGGLASSTKINSKRLVVDGEIAYESGYAEIASLKDGKLSVNGGRFLTIWQRQADGEWKILRNVVLP